MPGSHTSFLPIHDTMTESSVILPNPEQYHQHRQDLGESGCYSRILISDTLDDTQDLVAIAGAEAITMAEIVEFLDMQERDDGYQSRRSGKLCRVGIPLQPVKPMWCNFADWENAVSSYTERGSRATHGVGPQSQNWGNDGGPAVRSRCASHCGSAVGKLLHTVASHQCI
jgi:hypothetical protein